MATNSFFFLASFSTFSSPIVSLLGALRLSLLLGCQFRDELDGAEHDIADDARHRRRVNELLGAVAQFAEHAACVRVAAGRVSQRQEVEVDERREEAGAAHEQQDDDERHQKDLGERDQSQDVARLEFDQRDEDTRAPP